MIKVNPWYCPNGAEGFFGYFFYNGGGDSQDTANKVSQLSLEMGHPITCIGIPKTVDNDLPFTDSCPGFGSVAKYVAVSIFEASLDVASMAASVRPSVNGLYCWSGLASFGM